MNDDIKKLVDFIDEKLNAPEPPPPEPSAGESYVLHIAAYVAKYSTRLKASGTTGTQGLSTPKMSHFCHNFATPMCHTVPGPGN
jgi:hypothetical protein